MRVKLDDVFSDMFFFPQKSNIIQGGQSHEACLLVAQLVVRLVVPVAFASTNTEPEAELNQNSLQRNFVKNPCHTYVISGSDQRWHRSSESEGA